MGLTSWTGNKPTKQDTEIAKNYLNHQEVETLNRLVSMYLDFAELQAVKRRPMHMKDWIIKLDDFLRMTEQDILTHTGKVSHQKAIEKARAEYEKFYMLNNKEQPSLVEEHFFAAINKVMDLETKV